MGDVCWTQAVKPNRGEPKIPETIGIYFLVFCYFCFGCLVVGDLGRVEARIVGKVQLSSARRDGWARNGGRL